MPSLESGMPPPRFTSPDELATLLASGPRHTRLVLLDFRSHAEFGTSHIGYATNVVLPSLLLKRLQRGAVGLDVAVPGLKDIGNRMVVVYDAEATQASHVMTVVTQKLVESDVDVRVLRGGFRAFAAAHVRLCRGVESPPHSDPEDGAGLSVGLSSLSLSPRLDHSSGSEDSDPPLSTPFSSDNRTPSHGPPCEVLSHLYLGTAAHAADWETLQRLGVTHVLNVTSDLPNSFEHVKSLTYLRVPITDHWSQDVAVHLPKAIQFIDDARRRNGNVLVHCLAGISRSVTVTVAYLMQTRALSLNAAFDLVRACKPNVAPNFTFLQQLTQFERSLDLSPPSSS